MNSRQTCAGRPPTVLITGASRGLGAELSRQYAMAGWHVLACVRHSPPAGIGIQQLQLDVADEDSIACLSKTIHGQPIDVLINNAAVRGNFSGLTNLSAADFLDVMRCNVAGPLLVCKALLANIKISAQPIIANISSQVGSMTEGMDDDGDYAYRCSKAALNMVTVKLAHDYRPHGIIVLALHPGWIKTDMGGNDAPVPVAVGAGGIRDLISRATLADSGSFRNYNGHPIAW